MDFQNIIKILGVGGAGCNIINAMYNYFHKINIPTSNLVAMNTDIQSLNMCPSDIKTLQLGEHGLGAGSDAARGKAAAIYSYDDILQVIAGSKLVILCASVGGGTGSGATPEIAKIAKEQHCLVISIIITPFTAEGKFRQHIAEKAIECVKDNSDVHILISNDGLFNLSNKGLTMRETYAYINNVCIEFISSLVDMLYQGGFVNLDYSDLATTINNKGRGIAGIGFARGEMAAQDAVNFALNNPLMHCNNVATSSNALVYIVGNRVTLHDQTIILNAVNKLAGPDALVITGMREANTDGYEYDDKHEEGPWIKVMIVLTGIQEGSSPHINNTISQKPPEPVNIVWDI